MRDPLSFFKYKQMIDISSFDKKTKLLLLGLFIAILVAGYLSYQRTIIQRDFETFESENLES